MLIKSKKLTNVKTIHKVVPPEISEATKIAQMELHKARQEVKAIKDNAESILLQAQKNLEEANHKAKSIIDDANQKAAEIKEKIRKETLTQANAEAGVIKKQAVELLKEMFQVKAVALEQAHREIINIALEMAEKIIKYQASIDPNVLKTQVVESIKKATTEADRVQVFVNSLDLKILEESVPELQKLFPTGIDIIVLPKDSVDRGSCVVETKSGQLDASFSTQLKTLTNLVANLEVVEPQIVVDEHITQQEIPETISKKQIFEEQDLLFDEKSLKTVNRKELSDHARELMEMDSEELVNENEEESLLNIDEEVSMTQEETVLKQELLGDEPFINLLEQEDNFPIVQSSEKIKSRLKEEIETDEENIEVQLQQNNQVIELPQEIVTESSPNSSSDIKSAIQDETTSDSLNLAKKKIPSDETIQRKSEGLETEEEFEYFEEDEEEEINKEQEQLQVKSTLKPLRPKGTPQGSTISNIASDLEQNPEWKNLVEDEDE